MCILCHKKDLVFYAAPASKGNLSAAEIECLQRLFVKAKRRNIVSSVYDIDDLFDNCDQTLFRSSLYSKTLFSSCFHASKNTHMLAVDAQQTSQVLHLLPVLDIRCGTIFGSHDTSSFGHSCRYRIELHKYYKVFDVHFFLC